MSNPLIFFMIVIIIDLVLKSSKDKKKMEKARQKTQRKIEDRPYFNQESPNEKQVKKPEPIRGLMSTLREEIEKQKELERKGGHTIREKQDRAKREIDRRKEREYEKKKYWEEDKRKEEDSREETIAINSPGERKKNSPREDLIRGIIFSEILGKPKSIENQKRSI